MRRRAIVVVGAVALLALVVVAAGTGTPWRLHSPGIAPPPVMLPTEGSGPIETLPVEGTSTGARNYVVWVFVALTVLALVLGARRIVARLRRSTRHEAERPGTTAPPAGPAVGLAGDVDVPALVDAVQAALARLDEAGTPHDAVVAAWVELEHAAARHGWDRHPSETSTEFTTRLLDVSPLPPQHTATLRRLYQRARFTSHPVTAEHVAQAREALEVIARSVESRRP